MLTHFVSFSSQITAHFSLIFEPIRDQVCLLYPFLRSIHFQILMLLEISILQGTFSPGYLGEPVFLLNPIRFFSEPPRIIRKLSRSSLRCSMLSWPLCPHSGMIKLSKKNHLKLGGSKTTMKTSNYFAKLPQESSIKSIQTFRDYDLITLNLPAPRQRLCPRCGSTNCCLLYTSDAADE